MRILFWILFFVVFYTYIGYGIVVWILVKIKEAGNKKNPCTQSADLPDVTLFIAAYNEEAVVKEKIKNCESLDYPRDKFKVLWVTDGSDDATVSLIKEYINSASASTSAENTSDCSSANHLRMEVEHSPERRGKAAAFNRGIAFVKSPLVIFTDANTMLNKDAVKEIVLKFNNPKTGCVAGEKRVSSGNEGLSAAKDAAQTEGIYWKYESFLKDCDSRLYSAVGAAGELFAIRTKLFEALPAGTLLDDFVLSMRIAKKGYVISYCPNAYALEGSSANIKEESKRKIRISAGGLQSVLMLKELLNPFKYGVLCFEYVSHRVLRWTVTPVCLFLLLPVNVIIAALYGIHPLIYSLILALQILFYLLGLTGYLLSKNGRKSKIPYVCFYFLFMNICVIRGFFYLRNKRGSGIWERAQRA